MSSKSCPCCRSTDLEIFYELENIPVHSCLMVATREDALAFPTGDLRLGFCESCGCSVLGVPTTPESHETCPIDCPRVCGP